MLHFAELDAADTRIADMVQLLEPALSLATLRERGAAMAAQGAICLGIFIDAARENLIGIASYSMRTHFFSGRVLYVENVVFVPEQRGQNHGEALMQWLEQKALALDCQKVTLDAYARNTRARSFYERIGYDPRGVHFVKDLR
jgi:GNAT superfamily N-acetyltransferase